MTRERRRLAIDGRTYDVELRVARVASPEVPRLVVVSYLPNADAVSILDAFVRSVRRFTPEPHELWIVDNASPLAQLATLDTYQDVNLALSRTVPVPPTELLRWRFRRRRCQSEWGSYANAIGLEIARRLVDPASERFASFHMDTMAVRAGWLTALLGRFHEGVAAVGVRMDTGRVPDGVLHPLGCVYDMSLVSRFELDFLPALPALDVGDRLSIGLREAGYGLVALPNTMTDPSVADRIADPRFRGLPVDRCLDDDGQVIFLHLGRGLRKATGEIAPGLGVAEWVRLADSLIAA